MKTYTGTKTIKARPMNLGEYNRYKGWSIPADEDPEREGYLVGYPNADGRFNGPWEEGCSHISWSPRDVFEVTYKEGESQTKNTEALQQELLQTEIDLKRAHVQLVLAQIKELKKEAVA